MHAVIKTGGKQYKVIPGHILRVEKLNVDVGANMEFNDVLMVANGDDIRIGTPHVDGGKVTATVLDQARGKKVKILKFKRRKHHMKRMGHRQSYTEVKITGIMAEGIEATLPSPEEAEATDVEATSSETEAEIQNVAATALESVVDSQPVEAAVPEGETDNKAALPEGETDTQPSEVKQHGT